MDIHIPESLATQLHTLAAQVGQDPETLVLRAIEHLTALEPDALLSVISGEAPTSQADLLRLAQSLFTRS